MRSELTYDIDSYFRVYAAISQKEQHRGLVVQSGGAKVNIRFKPGQQSRAHSGAVCALSI